MEKLEDLNLKYTWISDISCLENNKNIKILNLYSCWDIKSDYSFMSKLRKLEELDLYNTNISDISFLNNNKNIKKLDIRNCYNIKDYSLISKLQTNKNIYIQYGEF